MARIMVSKIIEAIRQSGHEIGHDVKYFGGWYVRGVEKTIEWEPWTAAWVRVALRIAVEDALGVAVNENDLQDAVVYMA